MDAGRRIEAGHVVGGLTSDMSAYPVVNFEVDIPISHEMGEDEMMRRIVDHALSQLNDIASTKLAGSMPEGVVPMFTYSRSEAVEERHQKFLLQTINGIGGARTRKATIVEENDAAQKVIDELSINRHPVGQLLEQLRKEYGSHIGKVAMSDVIISIIKHTAYSRYRHALNEQISEWEPPAQEIVKKSSGLNMKGRPKSLFKSTELRAIDKSRSKGHKRLPRNKISPQKPRVKKTDNDTKAQQYSGKVNLAISRRLNFKQKFHRPGHKRTPRIATLWSDHY